MRLGFAQSSLYNLVKAPTDLPSMKMETRPKFVSDTVCLEQEVVMKASFGAVDSLTFAVWTLKLPPKGEREVLRQIVSRSFKHRNVRSCRLHIRKVANVNRYGSCHFFIPLVCVGVCWYVQRLFVGAVWHQRLFHLARSVDNHHRSWHVVVADVVLPIAWSVSHCE